MISNFNKFLIFVLQKSGSISAPPTEPVIKEDDNENVDSSITDDVSAQEVTCLSDDGGNGNTVNQSTTTDIVQQSELKIDAK